MKKYTLILVGIFILSSCIIQKILPQHIRGCFYDESLQQDVCGQLSDYNSKDSTYTIITDDHWAMHGIKSELITIE